ncbi:MAG TPA: DNA polymerase I [Terriglobia bacterium]|nr:DNA polymerase I [Terriglobia bacterium]
MTESAKGGRVVLIDAMSLLFRAFFAPMQTALTSPSGMPTKAIYIFLRTIRKLLKDYKPGRVGVAFDKSAPTFRDQLFEKYKSNRPPFPEDLTVQLPYVHRFCKALGLPLVEMAGFEADDLIGTLAREASSRGAEVFIASGDEDLFQLVDGNIKVVKPARSSTTGETVCDAAKVKEIIGVEPGQVVDWLALTGDSSDNIPGARPLPGREPLQTESGKKRSYIGPKGATELINRFGTLEAALDNYENVSRQSYREALRDFREEALLSRQLATIRTDVPLEIGLDKLTPVKYDVAEIRTLCQELGFVSLLNELLQESGAEEVEVGEDSTELRSAAEVEKWLKAGPDSEALAIAFDVEGDEGYEGRLAGIGLSDGKRCAVMGTDSLNALPEALGTVLPGNGRALAVHNSKLCRMMLGKQGIDLGVVAHDTMLYSYLLNPLASSHTLESLALLRMGRRINRSLGLAARYTYELAELMSPQMSRENLRELYSEIELPLSDVLADIETTGVKIDPAILAGMSDAFSGELTELTHQIYDLAGGAFDIDSPKQLGQILFEKLKMPGGKKLSRSGQYSTVAAVLESLAEEYELPRKIIDYRTRAKLKSTYLDALPKYINLETGRLHTCFNQAGSRTGRLSSSNPNLQNIPIGEEFGLRIRSAFVAEPGWRLIAADYSQIELRVLAHMSGDPVLIEAFTRGDDIHARTAQEIFGVPPALQNHEHRRMAKAINYGVIYGLSSFGLAARTGSSKTEAQQYIDAYFKHYQGVYAYLEARVEEARSSERVRTLFGRMRPMPEINSRDAVARNRAEREAMNTPLQGTAADLLKLAMVKAHERLKREKLRTRMILTVHDELVFESPDEEVEATREIIRKEMEGVYPLKAPLKVEIGTGKNWKEAK